MAEGGLLARIPRFSRDFWVINVIELFERGAFYSVIAVLAVVLTLDRGLDPAVVGSIVGSLLLLNYLVPIVSAPFSEKYGYKTGLVASFASVCAGYATLAFATAVPAVVAGVLLIGFGAGVFKPLAAALIGQTTTEDQRTTGFVVYYAFVNIGGFAFPLLVGLVGLRYPSLLAIVAFGTGVALAALNLLLSLVVFRNVRPPQREVRVLAALGSILAVFREWRLGVLVFVYTGFWVMYAMNQSWLPVYMVEFARMPPWFNPALMATLNPLVIILGAPVVGKLLQGRPPLASMVVGIATFAVGFVILGFSRSPWLFLLGFLVFGTGELITHPSYLSYVAQIAPKGKEAVYMGFAFLAIGLGYYLGAALGGVAYGRLAQDAGRPTTFWAVMASVGFVTVAALVLYNRLLAPQRTSSAGRRPLARLAGPVAAVIAVLLVPALVVTAGVLDDGALGPRPAGPAAGGALVSQSLPDARGTTEEGESTDVPLALPDGAVGNVTFVLTWSDEAGGTGTTNQPDTFVLEILAPDGTRTTGPETANAAGAEGTIELAAPSMPGVYEIAVRLTQAGDRTVQVGPFSLPAGGEADTGNAWTLAIRYESTA
ncbi:MAG TPA: MFS transporter [Candidatus Thermoplasmatota archaeon]|nr:MFS transporter [Candidatus Thermoplasmatota archaeon]